MYIRLSIAEAADAPKWAQKRRYTYPIHFPLLLPVRCDLTSPPKAHPKWHTVSACQPGILGF